jgi:hypothetical protein
MLNPQHGDAESSTFKGNGFQISKGPLISATQIPSHLHVHSTQGSPVTDGGGAGQPKRPPLARRVVPPGERMGNVC